MILWILTTAVVKSSGLRDERHDSVIYLFILREFIDQNRGTISYIHKDVLINV